MTSEVVFIGGRSGVGKTSVAAEMHAMLSATRIMHCVIEGDFLDMAYPAPWKKRLAERNLAAMWANYRALGYCRLIYTNTASVLPDVTEQLTTTIGDTSKVIPILLTCTDTTARKRLSQREIGSTLDKHLATSGRMGAELHAHAASAHHIATDDRSVAEVAADVIGLTGWLSAH